MSILERFFGRQPVQKQHESDKGGGVSAEQFAKAFERPGDPEKEVVQHDGVMQLRTTHHEPPEPPQPVDIVVEDDMIEEESAAGTHEQKAA